MIIGQYLSDLTVLFDLRFSPLDKSGDPERSNLPFKLHLPERTDYISRHERIAVHSILISGPSRGGAIVFPLRLIFIIL